MFGWTCQEVSDRTSEYLDGEMAWHHRVLFRLHLVYCSLCARFVREMELVKNTLPRLRERVALSDSTRAALVDAFEHEHGSHD